MLEFLLMGLNFLEEYEEDMSYLYDIQQDADLDFEEIDNIRVMF